MSPKNRLGLILLLTLVIRFIQLGQPLWLDEAAQVMESSRTFQQQLNLDQDFQPPLFHLYLHFLLYWSKSEWFLRLFSSVLFYLVGTYFFYLLAKKYFKLKVIELTLFFLAFSSFAIYFSQELRPYSLSFMLALMSWYFLESSKNPLGKWAIVSIFGLLSSYVYVVVFFSQILYLLLFLKTSIV